MDSTVTMNEMLVARGFSHYHGQQRQTPADERKLTLSKL
jgi:hypothetical protein